ncbi:diacylglycerol kinase family enzyme [Amycolatopsis lexingtonensis]|uniref:Diacylglycerol kinase family enzyme n=1 Tax=Amycolatopsis lexingtonensis TaxID=218822 RepID=A0ABR9IAX6_9PSEU|nr:hypothetical protein [Amycolatopsis lexingtonensis]MBE1500334.1 diacylglycerol kinase family enzyme [Amycolatopsis lexingtonensis]
MIGFETDLQDLRDSAGALQGAADAAEAASNGLRGTDVPVSSGGDGIFGGIAGMIPVANAFGRTLGMPAVAKAYNDHLAKIQKLVAQLHQTTADTSHALMRIAELYEKADEDSKQRVNRAAAGLEGN